MGKERITRGKGGRVNTSERGVTAASAADGYKWPFLVANETKHTTQESLPFSFDSLLSARSAAFVAVASSGTAHTSSGDVVVTVDGSVVETRVVGESYVNTANTGSSIDPRFLSWVLLMFFVEDDQTQIQVDVSTGGDVAVMLTAYQNVSDWDYAHEETDGGDGFWSARNAIDTVRDNEYGAVESAVVSTTKEESLHVYGTTSFTTASEWFGPDNSNEYSTDSMAPGIIWTNGDIGTGDAPQYSAFEWFTDTRYDSDVVVLRWAMWLHPVPGSIFPPGEQGCCMDEIEEATQGDDPTPICLTFMDHDEQGVKLYGVWGTGVYGIPFVDGFIPPPFDELPDPHVRATVWEGNETFFDPELEELANTHEWEALWLDSDTTHLYRLVAHIDGTEAYIQKLDPFTPVYPGFPFDEEWPVIDLSIVAQSANVAGLVKFLLHDGKLYTIYEGFVRRLSLDLLVDASIDDFDTLGTQEITVPHDYYAITVDGSIWVAGPKDNALLSVCRLNSGGRLVETFDVRISLTEETQNRSIINGMVAQGLNVIIGNGAT